MRRLPYGGWLPQFGALLGVLLGCLAAVGCGQPPAPAGRSDGERSSTSSEASPGKLTVAAAANLKFAFDQLEGAFERQHPDVDLEITYGSSGNFFAQLSQQAPFDMFFSADTRYPRQLVDQGHAEADAFFPYARGGLVVWVPNTSSLDLDTSGLAAVAEASVRKVAIANPRLAPYGVAAEEALRSAGVYDQVRDRLVLGDNITQAAQFAESGAADVGLIARSLALSPRMKQAGRYWDVPAERHRPIEQAAVILGRCRNPAAADQLRQFVLGSEGQRILADYGYSPPEP